MRGGGSTNSVAQLTRLSHTVTCIHIIFPCIKNWSKMKFENLTQYKLG